MVYVWVLIAIISTSGPEAKTGSAVMGTFESHEECLRMRAGWAVRLTKPATLACVKTRTLHMEERHE